MRKYVLLLAIVVCAGARGWTCWQAAELAKGGKGVAIDVSSQITSDDLKNAAFQLAEVGKILTTGAGCTVTCGLAIKSICVRDVDILQFIGQAPAKRRTMRIGKREMPVEGGATTDLQFKVLKPGSTQIFILTERPTNPSEQYHVLINVQIVELDPKIKTDGSKWRCYSEWPHQSGTYIPAGGGDVSIFAGDLGKIKGAERRTLKMAGTTIAVDAEQGGVPYQPVAVCVRDNGVLKFNRHEQVSVPKDMTGAVGARYVFDVLKPGTSQILVWYTQRWDAASIIRIYNVVPKGSVAPKPVVKPVKKSAAEGGDWDCWGPATAATDAVSQQALLSALKRFDKADKKITLPKKVRGSRFNLPSVPGLTVKAVCMIRPSALSFAGIEPVQTTRTDLIGTELSEYAFDVSAYGLTQIFVWAKEGTRLYTVISEQPNMPPLLGAPAQAALA